MSLTTEELYVPAGTTASAPYARAVDPERAGRAHSSLRIVELPAGGTHTVSSGDTEWIVVPLGGGRTVATEGLQLHLLGRDEVFAGVCDFAYGPRDAQAQIASGAGGRFALAGAKCERRLPARYGPAPEVPLEDRGSGICARQVRDFASADAFERGKPIAVAVVTPGGNWSSYPPHRHDEHRPDEESEREEIHSFEIQGPNGSGYQRVFPFRDGGSDVLADVRSGDAVLVPDGRHGPSIAAPGHAVTGPRAAHRDLTAGPGADREWRICFHPDHENGAETTGGYR